MRAAGVRAWAIGWGGGLVVLIVGGLVVDRLRELGEVTIIITIVGAVVKSLVNDIMVFRHRDRLRLRLCRLQYRC